MGNDTGAALAARDDSALSPELREMFEQDKGQGTENVTASDIVMPFLSIVQSLSPERKKSDAKYIEGAEEGHLFDSLLRDHLYDGAKGVPVVAVHFSKEWVRWVKRNKGGGFLGAYDSEAAAKDAVATPEDEDIVETANHWVLYQTADGDWNPAVVSCTKTKLKVSRAWNSRMQLLRRKNPATGAPYQPPSFAMVYRLGTVQQENKQKQAFFNFTVEEQGWVTDPALYAQAKALREAVKSGRSRAAYDSVDPGVEGTAAHEGGDMPF